LSDIQKGLRTFLLTKPEIVALVPAERIDPDILPQNPIYPSIALWVDSADSFDHLEGASGLTDDRVQIDIFSEVRGQATDIGELIRVAIQGYRGKMGDEFARGVKFVGKADLVEAPVDAGDRWIYIRSLDFEIVSSEQTTTTPTA